MSSNHAWVAATAPPIVCTPSWVEEVSDDGNEAGHYAVSMVEVGNTDGAVVYGTLEDLKQFFALGLYQLNVISKALGLECVCNIGVQECPAHPNREGFHPREDKDFHIEFRKDFDRRVEEGWARNGQ